MARVRCQCGQALNAPAVGRFRCPKCKAILDRATVDDARSGEQDDEMPKKSQQPSAMDGVKDVVRHPATIGGFVVFGLLVSCCVWSAFFKPPSPSDVSGASKKEKPNERPTPDETISAFALSAEFEDNKIRAEQSYKGRVLEVSGEVYTIGKSLGSRYVVLEGSNPFAITGRVQCSFSSKHDSELARLSKGDRIKICGKCIGTTLGQISLSNCYIP